MKKYLLLLFLIGFNTTLTLAQGQTDGELANQYMSTGDYEKAVVYFDRFYDKDPFNAYPGYIKCLIAIKDYDKAEKLARKQVKKFPTNFNARTDIGSILELKGEKEKALKYYSDMIKSMPADLNSISMLGSAFMQKQQYDLALQTYQQGKKLLQGDYTFGFETAEVYDNLGKTEELVNEYLDMINFQSGYIANVETILQNKLGNDPSGKLGEMLRLSLLRRIQKHPDEIEYSELLYWYFLQERDFDSALLQAKGIDKRLSENGDRVIALGKLCADNEDYATAEKCFQYVVDKGRSFPLYTTARIELINAVNNKVTNSGNYTQADLLKLEADYDKTINELGKSSSTATLIRGFAHLEAFYLHKADKAIDLLNETIALTRMPPEFTAACKLELGDIYVFTGDVWEAALLYGQVDKDFKNDALGREAKFRNARLSYYLGEFAWAREQLKVLKAATSQLISNDAISLELLIMDNTNLDSTTNALLVFSRAELLAFQNKDSLSLITLDTLLREFPNHMLTDEAWYKKAYIYKRNGRIEDAIGLYDSVLVKYGQDILADDALFNMADLYENRLNNKDKAKEYYEKLITDYPGSLYVVDARKRFRILRGEKIN